MYHGLRENDDKASEHFLALDPSPHTHTHTHAHSLYTQSIQVHTHTHTHTPYTRRAYRYTHAHTHTHTHTHTYSLYTQSIHVHTCTQHTKQNRAHTPATLVPTQPGLCSGCYRNRRQERQGHEIYRGIWIFLRRCALGL